MTVTLTPQAQARLQALAERRGQAPEAVIETALDALQQQEEATPPQPTSMDETEQARLHKVMEEIIAEAQNLAPEPYDSPTRTYYRESDLGQILAEKYRRQGFNL